MTQFERDLLRVLEEIKECLSDISINFEATLAAMASSVGDHLAFPSRRHCAVNE